MARISLAVLAALLIVPALQAQTPELRRVLLVDGTVLVGYVEDEAADPVVVVTESGIEQRVPRAQVDEILPLVGGRYTRVDPVRTRGVFLPTGRTLGGGRTRLGTLGYIVPQATVGLSDRVDLTGTVFFLGNGFESLLLAPALGAKVGLVDANAFAAAVGANVIGVLGDGTGGTFVLTPYGAVTLGNEAWAVSASVTGLIGASLEAGDFEAADGVLLGLGGQAQVANGVKLLLDVAVPIAEGTNGAVFTPGLRFFFADRFAADLFATVESDGGYFVPIANFSYTF